MVSFLKRCNCASTLVCKGIRYPNEIDAKSLNCLISSTLLFWLYYKCGILSFSFLGIIPWPLLWIDIYYHLIVSSLVILEFEADKRNSGNLQAGISGGGSLPLQVDKFFEVCYSHRFSFITIFWNPFHIGAFSIMYRQLEWKCKMDMD